VTLNLGGHTVDGTGNGFGIVRGGHAPAADVTIRNGTVRQFATGVQMGRGLLENVTLTGNDYGVSVNTATGTTVRGVLAFANEIAISLSDVTGATVVNNKVFGNEAGIGGGRIFDSVFERNSVHDNEFAGMGLTFARNNRISDNRIDDNGTEGILLLDGIDGNSIVDNRVTGSGTDGIALTGESIGSNLFERNRTDSNGDDGIDIDGPGSTLTRNTADYNGDLGIEAAPGVIDGGKNKAKGNGNPAQCVGVACK
jgi:parallel beta-helix repeat protein